MAQRALLCGINDFEFATDLKGCLNDLTNLRDLLIKQFRFDKSSIVLLRNEEVTKQNLMEKWAALLENAKPNDHLVLHISSHGSFIADEDKDEGEDGADELICMWDMQFGKPDTYLLDDELRAMLKQVPQGVLFTLITDTCHSASNDRVVFEPAMNDKRALLAFDQVSTAARAGDRSAGEIRDEDRVQVRFLPPPLKFAPKRRAIERKLGQPRTLTAAATHVHLAACQDHETAADAPIGGKYHGAFTYSFCHALRENSQLDMRSLERAVRRWLAEENFAQQPHFDGPARPAPVFGGGGGKGAAADPSDSPGGAGGGMSGDTGGGGGKGGGDSSDDERRMLIRILDRVTAANDARSHPRASRNDRDARPVLVCVHGISQHSEGYSDAWWESLRPHVGGIFGSGDRDVDRYEVIWSDIVNKASRDLVRDPIAEAEVAHAKAEIEATLIERQLRYADPSQMRSLQEDPTTLARGGGMSVDDFMRYMFSSDIRSRILGRFYDVIVKVKHRPIHLISHSWGTVVAYEGLLQPRAGEVPEVPNFFTVGAALSIPFVRYKLSLRKLAPTSVRRWYNIDAKGDPVGGALARHFPVTRDFVELEPTDCKRGFLGYDPFCAHRSYFRPDNFEVNANIFARYMNDSA